MNILKNPIVCGIIFLLVVAAVVICVLLINNNKNYNNNDTPNGIRFKNTLSKINIPFLSIFYPNQTTLNSNQINDIYIQNKNFIDTNFNEKTSKYLLEVNSKNCLEDKLLILMLTNLKSTIIHIITNIVDKDTKPGHASNIKGIMVLTLALLIYIKSKNSATYTLKDFCNIIDCNRPNTVWAMHGKSITSDEMKTLLTINSTTIPITSKQIFSGSGDSPEGYTITKKPTLNAYYFMYLFNHYVFVDPTRLKTGISKPFVDLIDKLIIGIQNSSTFSSCNLSINKSIDAQNALKLENTILKYIIQMIPMPMPGP